jgi:flavorubredoxin
MIQQTNQSVMGVVPAVQWIGILDPDLRVFDIVMETKFGTTYNAYFIDAEKKTIIDTSKEPFKDDFLAKVRKVCHPSELEYVVMNHTEPDHAGALKHLLAEAPKVTVVATGQALAYLSEMMGIPFKSLKVKDGDVLDLGNKRLRFVGAPNLHWPDTMFTYLVEDRVLFTCDCFGAHFSHPAMMDDLVGNYDEAFDYYFHTILQPYSRFMLKAVEKIRPLDIALICPGHGPVLRTCWQERVQRSALMAQEYLSSAESSVRRVLVAYVSAYGYTREMAELVASGINSVPGTSAELMDIEHASLGELEAALTRTSALVVGSPTINQNTLLPVYKLFAACNPIRDRSKKAMIFGSYGWSGEATDIIEANLRVLKWEVTSGPVRDKFRPVGDKGAPFVAAGKAFATGL